MKYSSLWKADGTPQKKFMYIFLNAKNRVIFSQQTNKANQCYWTNLEPLPPGKGKLKLVFGTYFSSVNRNHEFIIELNAAPYNYYSIDAAYATVAEIVPLIPHVQGTRARKFNFRQGEPVEILMNAKELQSISVVFQFPQDLTNNFRLNLGGDNFINFVFKFEYD